MTANKRVIPAHEVAWFRLRRAILADLARQTEETQAERKRARIIFRRVYVEGKAA